tara:strand:- start:2247 stop:2666 length:420 start_codon:yes stop_codon:yes gene_type:complete
MKKYKLTLMMVLLMAVVTGCATNGGGSKVKQTSLTAVLEPDGSVAMDSKGNPVYNTTNFYAKVSMKQLALAASNAIKDFHYNRTGSVLGDTAVDLGSSGLDAKIDPELVKAISAGLVDAMVGVTNPVPLRKNVEKSDGN